MALTRATNPMPSDIAALLDKRGLRTAYDARPAYQRNDYLGWIGGAKRPETRRKRLDQMLDELERGGVYMNMVWRGGSGS
ncbi:YdeI/OmpD-associated family protein [Pelagibacterium limicola]|uniref:YdeI/OmpD-associated family protein n=1 Tax=Pelagibacterium limicola TaxID=2791022 RepID=UPI0018B01575|nr:YdeI/OmpD-associated family protein [Pelagibacterium limicola]